VIERYNHPEIETGGSPELLLPPITITRNDNEHCLVEPSINSVRISFKLHQADQIEQVLTRMYMRFLMQRADSIDVIRRVPIEGFDVSFLITDTHLLSLDKCRLLDFLLAFLEEVSSEISQLKSSINSRGRAVAADFLASMAF
jgi:actin related protein 2/3 complex subunit 4